MKFIIRKPGIDHCIISGHIFHIAVIKKELIIRNIKNAYLFCDETFDGLDPVMRQAVKRLLADAVVEQQLTPIIASHNLRELEDIYHPKYKKCVVSTVHSHTLAPHQCESHHSPAGAI